MLPQRAELHWVHLGPDDGCNVPHLDAVLDLALVEDAALLERRRVGLGVDIEREEVLFVVDAPRWLCQHVLRVALLHLGVALDVRVHHLGRGQEPVCPDGLRIDCVRDQEHHGHLQDNLGLSLCCLIRPRSESRRVR